MTALRRRAVGLARYPPIGDYAFLGDCHSAALVSREGSVDWCCMPRTDSASCFGRLVDWERGGHFQVVPTGDARISRRYLEGTLVLETTFRVRGGEARLLDFLAMRRGGQHNPHRQLVRIVEGLAGSVRFRVDIVPRFDYGAVKPWVRRRGARTFIALGGRDGLLLSGDVDLEMERHELHGLLEVAAGQRRRLSLVYGSPEDLEEGLVGPPGVAELDRRLDATVRWWRAWSSRCTAAGPCAGLVGRSAIVLKGLTHAPSGAIAAAPTTSLPESPGGTRNWDYRYTWIRDSAFTVRSLAEVGHDREADGFRRFVERSAAGSADELQVLFGLGGERRLYEHDLEGLAGYRGARPVRVGNAAERQVQLDVYGELLDLAWRWHGRGRSPDDDYWEFLVELVGAAAVRWREPDRGIWEMRGEPRHFVLSKAMCWVAVDRGVRLAGELGRRAPLRRWHAALRQIRTAVEREGYDRRRGVFVQAFGHPVPDASLLLLPVFGFVDYRDERMVRTTDAIAADLGEGGLLRRYPADDDDLDGREGCFLACSFWLAECLARQGRLADAEEVFRRAAAAGNDLGLFPEEADPGTGESLGNFPQGLTHLSLIAAAIALDEAEEAARRRPGTAPVRRRGRRPAL